MIINLFLWEYFFFSIGSVYSFSWFQKNRALSLVSNGLEIFLILVFLIALLLTLITTNWVILTNYVNAKTILYQKTCIGKSKGPDQLCSNCTADQCLCFCYTKIVQFFFYSYPKFQTSSSVLWLYRPSQTLSEPQIVVFIVKGSDLFN